MNCIERKTFKTTTLLILRVISIIYSWRAKNFAPLDFDTIIDLNTGDNTPEKLAESVIRLLC